MERDAGSDPRAKVPAPSAPRQPVGKSPLRRLLRFLVKTLLVLLVVLPVLAVLLYTTRERTLHPLIVRLAPPIARVTAGLDLQLDGIDGDWRTTLHVAGLSLRKLDGEPLGILESVEVSEATVNGDLLGFARHPGRLELIESVRTDAPIVRLAFTGAANSAESSGSSPLHLPRIPRITVTGGDLTLRFTGETLHFTEIELDGPATDEGPRNLHTAVSTTEGWSGRLHGTITLNPMAGEVATGNVTLSGEGCQLHGSGALLADGRTLKDAELNVQLDSPGSLHPALESIRDLDAKLALSGDVAHPTGSITLHAGAVELAGEPLQDVAAKGALQDGTLELEHVGCKTEYGTGSASGKIGLPLGGKPLDIVLQTLAWESESSSLTLADPVPISLDGDRVKIEGLVLTTGEGRAALDFDSATDDGLALDLDVRGLELEPFIGHLALVEGLRFGALNGTAAIRTKEAATQDMKASVDLTLDRSANQAFDPVSARLKASWSGGRIAVDDCVVELAAIQLQVAGGAPLHASAKPLGPGDLNLQVRLGMHASALSTAPLGPLLGEDSAPLVERISGRAFASAELKGTWDALRGTLKLDLEDARLAPAVGTVPLLPEALSGSLALRLGDSIELEPSHVRLGKVARALVKGSLDQSLNAAAMVADPTARWASWQSSAIQGDANVEFDSLDWLARFLPELRETSGELTGTGKITGTLAEPVPTGTLALKDGGARYRGLPPLEKAQVEVAFEAGQIRIERADMEVGASPVSIGGTVLRDQGKPRIDATIKGTEVLLARSADARIRADLNLTLKGRTNALTVGGDVALVGGRIRSPIEFQSLLAGGSKAPQAVRRGVRIPAFGPPTLALDLEVRTSEALALKGRIARGTVRAHMKLVGTAAQPTPIGQVFFDPLELAVPAGTIRFPTGLIRFDPDSPDIPRIDLVGTTRLAGYDVTVNVDGDYDAPNVQLSSSPPLAPEDLLLLVLSGQTPSRGGGVEAAGQSVALYVAKDLVRGWFSSGGFEDEDKESFLDRLQVTTGRDVSRSGVLTLEATYKLREGLARERDAIYVVLERDSYEDYGLGLRFVLRLR